MHEHANSNVSPDCTMCTFCAQDVTESPSELACWGCCILPRLTQELNVHRCRDVGMRTSQRFGPFSRFLILRKHGLHMTRPLNAAGSYNQCESVCCCQTSQQTARLSRGLSQQAPGTAKLLTYYQLNPVSNTFYIALARISTHYVV